MINGTRERRYQAFILTAFSMGLRIHETLNLRIGDIDAQRMKVHIRLGKGKKDRFVTLPEATLIHLRQYWATHRHPNMIFPAGRDHQERQSATKIMDRGGLQKAFKAIQTEMGHECPKTTALYTQLTDVTQKRYRQNHQPDGESPEYRSGHGGGIICSPQLPQGNQKK